MRERGDVRVVADQVGTYWYHSHQMAHEQSVRGMFGALVVHPDGRFRPGIRSAVSWFAARQTVRGDWGSKIPFFQAFNAMAHLSIPEANSQVDDALKLIIDSQNDDGTWGSADKEWQTFLVVHALRNKGIL